MGDRSRQGEPDLFLSWRRGGHGLKPRPLSFTPTSTPRLPVTDSVWPGGFAQSEGQKEVPPAHAGTGRGAATRPFSLRTAASVGLPFLLQFRILRGASMHLSCSTGLCRFPARGGSEELRHQTGDSKRLGGPKIPQLTASSLWGCS